MTSIRSLVITLTLASTLVAGTAVAAPKGCSETEYQLVATIAAETDARHKSGTVSLSEKLGVDLTLRDAEVCAGKITLEQYCKAKEADIAKLQKIAADLVNNGLAAPAYQLAPAQELLKLRSDCGQS